MRRNRIFRNFLKGFFSRRHHVWALASLLPVLFSAAIAAAADKISVFPEAAYDRFIIYESLAVFWIAIISLIVILKMKLREIERIQALGVDREDKDAPLLK